MIEPKAGHGLMHRPATKPADGSPPRAKATYARKVIADAVTEAEGWLLDQGASPWEVAARNLAASSRIAWWHDTAGFVQESHPDATLVVIVDVPSPDPVTAQAAAPVEIPAERGRK